MKLVVVGNGMVSHAFCRWLTEGENPIDFSITVIGDEPRPAYDRVNLTAFFDGKSAEQLELAPRHWYADRGIELITGQRVTEIDRSNKTVVCDSGTRHAYDQLVLATGSRPFVPPIKGVDDHEGIFVYRTIEDLEEIESFGKKSKSAAVLGGGLLGLEAAKAMRDMGLIPHVIEMAPGLMPRQLDVESARILKERVERMGVKVHLPRRTQSIERHGDYLVVHFDTGESLAVDMVVISAGIRPNDQLAKDADLTLGRRGGIAVNDELQTSDPNIFAIGECVAHRDALYGLVAPCYQMAKCLADHLAGKQAKFEGGDKSARLKLLGIDVCSFGEPIGDAPGTIMVSGETDEGSRKLLIRDRRIVGAIGVGGWSEADRVQTAVADLYEPWSWQIRRFRKQGRLFPETTNGDVTKWPPNALICSCLQIKRSELTSACQRGCETVEALAKETGASTVCGSCKPLLARMIGKAEDAVEAVAGWRGLLIASITAIVGIVLMKLFGPISFSESVTDSRHWLDFFWRDDFWKQVSGYTLLGITVLTLLFSARKRIKQIKFGQFGNWRMAHGILGVVTLIGVVSHTGMHWGSNLNFWLMTCFIGINLVGGFTGAITALESRVSVDTALVLRQWRPRMTWIHILLFWPLPILIAAHVFCIYYY